MSKELTPLEALKRHRKSIVDLLDNGSILPELHYVFMQELNIIETALKKLDEAENCVFTSKEDVKKELKALEIIKDKEVNVFIFLHSGDLETYNDMVEENRKLTQEEYDLLKEVFNGRN